MIIDYKILNFNLKFKLFDLIITDYVAILQFKLQKSAKYIVGNSANIFAVIKSA